MFQKTKIYLNVLAMYLTLNIYQKIKKHIFKVFSRRDGKIITYLLVNGVILNSYLFKNLAEQFEADRAALLLVITMSDLNTVMILSFGAFYTYLRFFYFPL